MIFDAMGYGWLVHVALGFYVLGLMARDVLVLRSLLLCGTVFYVLYYSLAAAAPLWDAIFASTVIGLVNLTMIVLILRERSSFGMDADMRALHARFDRLTPGQFRRAMALARRGPVEGPILIEGERPARLHFLAKGGGLLVRGDLQARVEPGRFLGEIAFLQDGPASATVHLDPGSVTLSWDAARLKALMAERPAFGNAFTAQLTTDLAAKLRGSMPEASVGFRGVAPDPRHDGPDQMPEAEGADTEDCDEAERVGP